MREPVPPPKLESEIRVGQHSKLTPATLQFALHVHPPNSAAGLPALQGGEGCEGAVRPRESTILRGFRLGGVGSGFMVLPPVPEWNLESAYGHTRLPVQLWVAWKIEIWEGGPYPFRQGQEGALEDPAKTGFPRTRFNRGGSYASDSRLYV